jgi:murein DD-endopeptidase MepM/ murein hydrolase activator NlpD
MSDWNESIGQPVPLGGGMGEPGQIMPGFEVPLSVYEQFKPRFAGLADQFAKARNETSDLQAFMFNARELGMDSDTQDRVNKEKRLTELVQQFTESTKDLDDTEYQKAAQDFAQKMGAPMPQRQEARLQQVNPIQGLFSVLGMALNPEFAGDIATATLQGGIKERDRQQGINDQKYGDDIRNRNADIGNAQEVLSLEERRLGKREASRDRQLGLLDRQIRDLRDGIEKLDEKDRKTLEGAHGRYERANLPGEKLKAGRALQQLLGKDNPLAPSDAEIDYDVKQLERKNLSLARNDWESSLKNEINQFGQVSDARFKDLEAQRTEIAFAYGINPDVLRKTPTERTLKEEQMKLAEDKFSFLKGSKRQELKIKWANLKVAQARAATYAQAVANGYGLGLGNLQQRQFSNELSSIRLRAKEFGDTAASQLKTLQNDVNVAATKAAANPTDANNGKLAEARAMLDQFLQETAQELGVSPGDFLKDPAGTVKKMFQETEQTEVPSAPQITLPPGTIGGYATPTEQKKSNAALKRKPKAKSNPVDEAKKRGFIIG